MWEASLSGLVGILRPDIFAIMMLAVILGTLVSILPGIGTTALLTMCLPFAMVMSPYGAIALMMGIHSIANTGCTITSVLTGIPGSSASIATVVEGFPMTKRGLGARAVGAGLMASIVGGLLGAIALTASLPIFKPLITNMGSPEFFMFTMWGISMVVMLSGRAPLKGVLAAILGMFIMMVGLDLKSGTERWVFGQIYLWERIDIILPALGTFAIPEVINMAVSGGSIAREIAYGSGMLEGIKDTFRHWFLVLRSSVIGVWVGFIPGIGGPVASWVALGDAMQSSRGKGDWGRGDIRGVIAPEACNNSVEGGTMIPTLVFGIPGSTSCAIMLIAFMATGMLPGPEMLRGQLNLTFAVIWCLVITNIIAGAACLALARPIARVAFWPFHVMVPPIIVLCILGTFSANYQMEDLVLLLVFSSLGFFMRRLGWPRAPLLLGAVLGPISEKYLWLSTAHFGAAWLIRPWVIVIFCLIVVTAVVTPMWERRQRKKRKEGEEALKKRRL